MTRETKIGLLVGLAVILLVGIILTDHLAIQPPDGVNKLLQTAEHGADSLAPQPAPAETGPPQQESPERETAPGVGDRPSETTQQPTAEHAWQFTSKDDTANGDPPVAAEQADADRQTVDDTTAEGDQPDPAGQVATDDTTVGGEQHRFASPLDGNPDRLRPGGPGATEVVISKGRIYFVEPGDTLYAIAAAEYGDGRLWRQIRDANRKRVSEDGSVVKPGVRLVLPPRVETLQGHELTNEASLDRDATPADRDRLTAGGRNTITVQPSDTLSGLAARHLGSSRKWQVLFEANRDKIESPEALRVGTVLVLPTAAAGDDRGPGRGRDEAAAADRPTAVSKLRYVVKPNDNLWLIALGTLGDGNRYNEIYDLNRDKLRHVNDVYPGQKLKIPLR